MDIEKSNQSIKKSMTSKEKTDNSDSSISSIDNILKSNLQKHFKEKENNTNTPNSTTFTYEDALKKIKVNVALMTLLPNKLLNEQVDFIDTDNNSTTSWDKVGLAFKNYTGLDDSKERREALLKVALLKLDLDSDHYGRTDGHTDGVIAWKNPELLKNIKINIPNLEVLGKKFNFNKEEKLTGDYNNDGLLDYKDRTVLSDSIRKSLSGEALTTEEVHAGDFDKNGKLDWNDLKSLSNLININLFYSIEKGGKEGDFNNDGEIDNNDYHIFISTHNLIGVSNNPIQKNIFKNSVDVLDINKDGILNAKDFDMFEKDILKLPERLDSLDSGILGNMRYKMKMSILDPENYKQDFLTYLSQYTKIKENKSKTIAMDNLLKKRNDVDGDGKFTVLDAIDIWENS